MPTRQGEPKGRSCCLLFELHPYGFLEDIVAEFVYGVPYKLISPSRRLGRD
jgi:hypothetical protein